MTIDEARTALGKERKYALHENKQAFDIAIDTMRKYQRIQEIVKEWREIGLEYDSCDAMMNIERVLEDEVN